MTERKLYGVAIHWRGADPRVYEAASETLERRFAPAAANYGLELLPFDGGLELRPKAFHKGLVVERAFAELGDEAAVAYLGDDRTDEDAFAALRGRGLPVLVRPEPRETLATAWLQPPGEVLAFLAEWNAACSLFRPMSLVVVSNRLPFTAVRGENGEWQVEPGSGGLVTALRPVLGHRGGRWIGWSGATEEELPDAGEVFRDSQNRFGYELVSVPLSTAERDGFYSGFSNEIVWPLFHDLVPLANFDPSYWNAYEAVNERFADTIVRVAAPDDLVWVHDYHLMRVATALAARKAALRAAFFLHIPFPPLDVFLKLPWRFQVLQSLLDYDLVGFQTVRDRRNFVQCVRLLLPEVRISGRGAVWTMRSGKREVRVGSFAISVDSAEFERRARQPEVAGVRGGDPLARAGSQARARDRPAGLHEGPAAEARGLPDAAAPPSRDAGTRDPDPDRRAEPGGHPAVSGAQDASSTGSSARSTASSRAAAGRRSATSTGASRGIACRPTTAPPTSRSSRR